jgi:hypothetical protein
MSNHLNILQLKHSQIEKNLMEEQLRPYPDSRLIIELKQKKLRLKEKIYCLKRKEA